MKRIALLTLISAGAIATPAHAAAKLSLQDRAYLDDGASGVAFEIKAGNTALRRATTSTERAFAQRMISDHGTEENALRALGQQLGVTLEFKPNKVQSHEIAVMAKHKGHGFDRAYACAELDDHKMDIYAQRLELREGSNAAVQAFTRRFFSMYRAHLSLARKDAAALKLNCN
jgi:predicted outer membrane protein